MNVRQTVCEVLLYAHNNPKGKWRRVTLPILEREVKKKLDVSREEVLKEVRYLVDAKIVKLTKETQKTLGIGRSKPRSFAVEYYSLYSSTIDRMEKNNNWEPIKVIPQQSVSISNSIFYAPFAIGSENNIVTFETQTDIDKVLNLISQRTESNKQEEITKIVKTELAVLLENPEKEQAKKLINRLQAMGQTWLVPIITQLVATYFQHKLGINT